MTSPSRESDECSETELIADNDDTKTPPAMLADPTETENCSVDKDFDDNCNNDDFPSSTSSTSSNDEEDDDVNKNTAYTPRPKNWVTKRWSFLTGLVHHGITRFILFSSMLAARNPKRTIWFITFISFALIIVGFFTNFNIQVDYEKVYAPFNSVTMDHKTWISDDSGFPDPPRPLAMVLHNDGGNVLGRANVERLFEAIDTVRNTPGYDEMCEQSNSHNAKGEPTCKITSATRFWHHSADIFHQEIHNDHDVIEAMSASTYPGGVPVIAAFNFGNVVRKAVHNTHEKDYLDGTKLESAESFLVRINIPDAEGVVDFEVEMLNRLFDLKSKWEEDPTIPLKLSYFTMLSYELEFQRAIEKDLILVPFVGLIMCVFTCMVFYKRDRVKSRCLFGLGTVAAVGLSIMAGFGLMFIIGEYPSCVFAGKKRIRWACVSNLFLSICLSLPGVPFTSMTQILPFIVFGVGLDDTFIITGAYFRTNPNKDTEERVRETMLEVGQSISLTTITTALAFVLGCMSSIPAIRWVCLYAFPTIFLVYVYSITFVVALLVLDERRIKENRKDCCQSTWCIADDVEYEKRKSDLSLEEKPTSDNDSSEASTDQAERTPTQEQQQDVDFITGLMKMYAVQLMRPGVKVVVVLLFMAYSVFCAYCTTQLTQRFRTADFVPEGSYVADFLHDIPVYSEQKLTVNVYFRDLNQSDPVVQQEMRDYLHDLMEVPAINGSKPPFCWVLDFDEKQDEIEVMYGELTTGLSFSDKLTLALNNPAINEAYGDDIVRDENGTIIASRCWINPSALDMNVVKDQIDYLADQRDVSLAQPVNKGASASDIKFFTFDTMYFIIEFYGVAVNELIYTTISGIIAVTVIGFFLIEHWTATLFVLPTILVLYVELLGTLQWAGLYINVVTYVCMVISIGLLVDFLMHIVLKYYESPGKTREDKVKYTLETMGGSILVGGLSTFLGTIPLAFSTSVILRTVFTAFFSMVTLGVLHGLILLPVVLSLLGPEVLITPDNGESLNGNLSIKICMMKMKEDIETSPSEAKIGSGASASSTNSYSEQVTEEDDEDNENILKIDTMVCGSMSVDKSTIVDC